MAYIDLIDEERAEGLLARIFEASRKRAGRVYNIIKVQGHSPPALQGMLDLYRAVMFGDSSLTRAQREMLAVVVSKTNGCHY